MTSAPADTMSGPPAIQPIASVPLRQWIVGPWVDYLLIILTPLLSTPVLLLLYSSGVGVSAETISVIVAAFFATGHHLPGLIRAYGDSELFERFRWRFLFAPPLLFLAYFPLYTYHFDAYRLIILFWATWHALMQVYGFVRIYDAKVGSTSAVTAYWDWLVCLCGFVTPQLFCPERFASFLGHWYSIGGPLIPPWLLNATRWTCLVITLAILTGFAVNYVVQLYRGPKPNPLKLLMLSSSIGLWWFTMFYVDNLLLSVALFDICHDVQYLAIVWLFNCRRVNANPHLGGFLRFVFRRGMVFLYLGLITAYGAMAFAGSRVFDGTVSRIFYGVLFTSTILHYYYDGFIWKVRETTNQAGLGLSQSASAARIRHMAGGKFAHLLKWSPAIVVFGFLFAFDFLDPSLTTDQKNELDSIYARSLTGSSVLPPGNEERVWLYSLFEKSQNIAATVPNDRHSQLRAAIMLANFGRNDESVGRLEDLLRQHPDFRDAHIALGDIHYYRGNLDQASDHLQSALTAATTGKERAAMNLRLGEIDLHRKNFAAATERFRKAAEDDPQLEDSIKAIETKSPGFPDAYP